MISYGCVYKRSSNSLLKGSRVETIENARKKYKQYQKKVGKRPVFIEVIFKDKIPLPEPLRNNL